MFLDCWLAGNDQTPFMASLCFWNSGHTTMCLVKQKESVAWEWKHGKPRLPQNSLVANPEQLHPREEFAEEEYCLGCHSSAAEK